MKELVKMLHLEMEPVGVNSVPRATLARTFSHTLTGKQPHRHGGQPHPENSSIMISAHGIV